MKVLLLHNRYQQQGGEDSVFEAEASLLTNAGFTIRTHVATNDAIDSVGDNLRTAIEAPYSRRAYKAVLKNIAMDHPDVVHVHNFFPLLTPSIFDACQVARVPVVLTLHNYRITCANGLLLRDGRPCSLCINGSPYWSVAYRCYRDSRLGSLAVANMIALHRWRRTWQRSIDRFIALSNFARNKFIAAGLPPEKIDVKPNFIFDPQPDMINSVQRKGALFVGRLSHEKGINVMLEAWKSSKVPLTIIGDGPAVQEVRAAQSANLIYLGPLASKDVIAAMAKSRFLLMPSIYFEGFPRVIAEAFAAGLPILASRIGSLEELIKDDYNGYHFNAGDPEDLLKVVSKAFAAPDHANNLSRGARQTYERYLTPQENLRQLKQIYHDAILQARNRTAS